MPHFFLISRVWFRDLISGALEHLKVMTQIKKEKFLYSVKIQSCQKIKSALNTAHLFLKDYDIKNKEVIGQ